MLEQLQPAAHASSRLVFFLAAAVATVFIMIAIVTAGFTRWPDSWSSIKAQSWIAHEAQEQGIDYQPEYKL